MASVTVVVVLVFVFVSFELTSETFSVFIDDACALLCEYRIKEDT